MSKFAQKFLRPIVALMRGSGLRSYAPAREAVYHDPNVRAGGYDSRQANPGLFGLLVSTRDSRY